MSDPKPGPQFCRELEHRFMESNEFATAVAKGCPQYCSKFEAQMSAPRNMKTRILNELKNTNKARLQIRLPQQIKRIESLEGITFLGKSKS